MHENHTITMRSAKSKSFVAYWGTYKNTHETNFVAFFKKCILQQREK